MPTAGTFSPTCRSVLTASKSPPRASRLMRKTDILLQVGNNVQINASLQVGAISENIEVKSQASMVETRTTPSRKWSINAAFWNCL